MNDKTADVIVIGGGVAGLSTAMQLAFIKVGKKHRVTPTALGTELAVRWSLANANGLGSSNPISVSFFNTDFFT